MLTILESVLPVHVGALGHEWRRRRRTRTSRRIRRRKRRKSWTIRSISTALTWLAHEIIVIVNS